MFETFNVPTIYVLSRPCFAVHLGPHHRHRLASGDGVSHTVPLDKGHAPPHAGASEPHGSGPHGVLHHDPYGARPLLRHDCERQLVRDGKAKLCYIAVDSNTEVMSAAKARTRRRPSSCRITNIRTTGRNFRCPEVLFHPNFVGKESNVIQNISMVAVLTWITPGCMHSAGPCSPWPGPHGHRRQRQWRCYRQQDLRCELH